MQTERYIEPTDQIALDHATLDLARRPGGGSRQERDRLVRCAVEKGLLLPVSFSGDLQRFRVNEGLAAFGETPITRDGADLLVMSDAGRKSLTSRGLKPDPEPDPDGDTDRLLAMTLSGRQALAARGLRNSEIEALQDARFH
jgi:hypothetical protein